MRKRAEIEPIAELDPEEAARDRNFVTALARGLEVLRAFRVGNQPMGNQELAEITGLPKPTVSRLTYTLTRLGYLSYNERIGKYRLGSAVLTLGYSMLAGLTVRDIARPLLQEIADYSGVSAALGDRDRLNVLYVECCRADTAVTLRLDVGSRIPIATSAIGRAFLAGLPEQERGFLMEHIQRRSGAEWPKIREGIMQALDEVNARGFCTSIGEWTTGVNAVGVPLRRPSGGLMAINCGGPSFIVHRERIEKDIGPRLVRIAQQIEASLVRR
ncbi:IclR family transcriptional regulator [Tistrella mobilis]|jgi:DNA-binding IclR family transcriptional regulator|uniref:IclR family transcriptional regulator n=1 Tax=Tistrella mobilis TaxID=171437 RepID=UPI0035575EC3